MKISRENLEKFKRICKEKTGVTPNDEDALRSAGDLLNLIKIISNNLNK